MSFENLKKPELVAIAEQFGTRSTGTKAELVEDLAAEGVTWELYESLKENAEPVEEPVVDVEPITAPPVVEESGEEVLLKFLGSGSLRTADVKVSATHPFVNVSPAVAAKLQAKNSTIWRDASPKELEKFYA
jgi:hypothetical protein